MTIGRVSDSHPNDDQQLEGCIDIVGTATEEDNSDEEDEMKIAVIESQPLHGDRQLVSYFPIQMATESLVIIRKKQLLTKILTRKLI